MPGSLPTDFLVGPRGELFASLMVICSLTPVSSIGYVEFRTVDLVEKAIALSGTIVMGLPIMVQLTESERNKTHAGDGCAH